MPFQPPQRRVLQHGPPPHVARGRRADATRCRAAIDGSCRRDAEARRAPSSLQEGRSVNAISATTASSNSAAGRGGSRPARRRVCASTHVSERHFFGSEETDVLGIPHPPRVPPHACLLALSAVANRHDANRDDASSTLRCAARPTTVVRGAHLGRGTPSRGAARQSSGVERSSVEPA
jgi:hypothetical protein